MIIKVNPGEKIQDANTIAQMVRYVRAEREQDAGGGKALSGYGGSNFGAAETEGKAQLRHFLQLARSAPDCTKPMMHVVFSWAEGERPAPEQVRQAIRIWTCETGAEGLDLIWATHGNTAYMHTHVLICMVDPLTTQVRDLGLWKLKTQQAQARIVGLQSLMPCANDLYLPEPDEDDPIENLDDLLLSILNPLEIDRKKALKKAREVVLPAAEKAASWAEFHAILAASGIGIRKSKRGCAYIVNGLGVNGTEVSNAKAAMKVLEVKFGPYVKGLASVKSMREEEEDALRNRKARHWRRQEPDGQDVLPTLCSKAQDVEHRHGIKSWQRLAQEIVPAALERAKSSGGGWQAFHRELASAGFIVQPAGKGMVYAAGGIGVKASHVGIRCGRAQLEETFGAFEPAPEETLAQADAAAAAMKPEPADGMPPELVPWWQDYMRDRNGWLEDERRLTEQDREEKRKLTGQMQEQLQEELRQTGEFLKEVRRQEGRSDMLRDIGTALRMALRKRGQMRLKERRKRLTAETRQERRRFPDSFAAWLDEHGQTELASRWRHRLTAPEADREQFC